MGQFVLTHMMQQHALNLKAHKGEDPPDIIPSFYLG